MKIKFQSTKPAMVSQVEGTAYLLRRLGFVVELSRDGEKTVLNAHCEKPYWGSRNASHRSFQVVVFWFDAAGQFKRGGISPLQNGEAPTVFETLAPALLALA